MAEDRASFNTKDINNLVEKLRRLAGDTFLVPRIKVVVDDGANMVANHAKERHYFVGTASGADARALAHELDFRNPDGSLRFKIRTANLQNSIQPRPAVYRSGAVSAEVRVGMKYARAVEEGAPGRRAFPFMGPAIEAQRGPIRLRLKNALTAMLHRFGGGSL